MKLGEKKMEKPKMKWHNAVVLKVDSIELERTGQNNEYIDRVRLYTNKGEITHKPRKQQTVKEQIAGFNTVVQKTETYTLTEFTLSNEMLKVLNENCLKSPQEIVISYATMTTENKDGEEVEYNFMRDEQFKTIYYEKYHKDNKENLKKQRDKAKRYQDK